VTTPPIQATYSLIDHHGTPVTERSYRGRWQLVQFGFTSCKVVCPRALAKLTAVLDTLEHKSGSVPLVALYVTVDPDRDSPAHMKAFLEASYPGFTGLTGTPEQIDRAKDAFRVFTRRRDTVDPGDGYDVQHTAITYLLDPDGRPAHCWPDTHTAETIAADLVRFLDPAT
jgi:protein SCO1/2